MAFDGLLIMSISDNGYTHLFAYQPDILPFTRLTEGNWDDIQPALSPDGTRVAFSSRRFGRWDIFILNFTNGATTQVTDTQAYAGAPTWSPDGLWLAFESYADGNLEIYIIPIDGTLDPIRLTIDGAADFAPSWSPEGRLVAFTSNRHGANDIWIANLDVSGDARFINFTRNPSLAQSFPAWSPDGSQLAWSSQQGGVEELYAKSWESPDSPPKFLGNGRYPVWSPGGDQILTPSFSTHQHYISSFNISSQTFTLPPLTLPGRFEGITWGKYALPEVLPANLISISETEPTFPQAAAFQSVGDTVFGRQVTLGIPNLDAPHPELNALAIEPYITLRERVNSETGWDVLSTLENAFVPITEPLDPGLGNDWLYTGRAIALNPILLSVGWMSIVREDIGAQTYWRIFIRTRNQDGTQGRPMYSPAWDFNARFTGNTIYYEEGGTQAPSILPGYWLDITELAREFGWERVPALSNWRSYYQGARFTELVITSGLSWATAMLQLYPPEIFITPTPVRP